MMYNKELHITPLTVEEAMKLWPWFEPKKQEYREDKTVTITITKANYPSTQKTLALSSMLDNNKQ